jgi:hypothetical protein
MHTEESPLRMILGMEKTKPTEPNLTYAPNETIWNMAQEQDWFTAQDSTRNDVWLDRPEFFKFLVDFEKLITHRVLEETAHKLGIAAENWIGTTAYGQGYRTALYDAEQQLLDEIHEQKGTGTTQAGKDNDQNSCNTIAMPDSNRMHQR